MITDYTAPSLEISHRKLQKNKLFWIGFAIYSTGFVLSMAMPEKNNQCMMLQAGGLAMLLISAMGLIRFRIENLYLRIFFILYCAWTTVVIFKNPPPDYQWWLFVLFSAWYSIFLYFVPLIILFPPPVTYLKRLFDIIGIFSLIYIVFCVLFRGILLSQEEENLTGQSLIEYFAKTLCLPSAFILFTYIYHSKKRLALAALVILATLVLATIRARRGLMVMTGARIVFFYFLFFYLNRRKMAVIIVSLFLFAGLIFYGVKVYNENKKGIFSLITERANEDTRSDVEDCFYADMKPKDWLYGKGMLGEYYCTAVDDPYQNYRNMIETDYLNIILKGGFVSLGLLLLIAIPAMIKALFYSKNILSKAAGAWILLWLMDLYPATVVTFTLNYFLVWIAIAIGYSKMIRQLTDTDIKELLAAQGYK